jgi:uncharacterized short protein YbdD (DUF466 family)
MGPGNPFKRFWQLLRQLTGEDAYERYRAHHMSFHGSETAPIAEAPLTRQQFFKRQQEEKWSKVSRCC